MADQFNDLRSVLLQAEAPRSPSGEFARSLRAELIDGTDSTVHELSPTHISRNDRSPRTLIWAAAAAVVIAIGLLAWQRGPTTVDTTRATQPPSTFPSPDLDAGRRACDTFRDTAFAPRLRNDVVRIGNTTALATGADLTDAIGRLELATANLRTSLEAAGFGRDTVRRPLDRIAQRLRNTAKATEVNELDTAREELRKVDDQLVQLTTALGSLGLRGCL